MSCTHLRLSAAFASILSTVTTGMLVTACGGGGSGTTPTEDGGSSQPQSLCQGQPIGELPTGLTIEPAVDFVSLRYESAWTGSQEIEAFRALDIGSTGSVCATAKDVDACRTKVAARVLPTDRASCVASYAEPRPSTGCAVRYFRWTRGDEVGQAVTRDEVKKLMGTIDTIQEAKYLLEVGRTQPTCNAPADYTVRTESDGYVFRFMNNCEKQGVVHVVKVGRDGEVTETATESVEGTVPCAMAGRRPDGFVASHATYTNVRGAYFASIAELEAAAVIAFRRLARDLAALGAPRELLDRVRTAIRDEVRHTRATRALALRDGVHAASPRLEPYRGRDLLAVAIENAREGCVRETFAALVACRQAASASDGRIRATMRAIADEETSHAALSWDIAAWLESRLDDAGREAVRRARDEAITELATELLCPVAPVLEESAGLPPVAEALAMLDAATPMLRAA